MELFEHNEVAYESMICMLKENGKAAIIHPTGTGKSFIGLKLCEDNPEKRVCWLSPSEYIFKTQAENWEKAGGKKLENVCFYTYAKLMLMSESKIEELAPDYIVLDEFHRCGAEMWGAGVRRLLDMYPCAPVIGLSATNIRYLDNQRDMADELFDGNVASEMTLGEAIVRGILNSPKYVISLYSCAKDLKRYEARVKRSKNKAVRDDAEKYLEAIRHSLEKAEGLDKVFAKHMPEKRGKYIVFCSAAEHMEEMIFRVPEWFSRVDEKPHVYRAYSEDPETSKAFADFKKDESEHLKLLFCIDMLNEGVHVEDVDGVILFRPTVSPIIYKQQIGRAMSASKAKKPVIFDVVNNFENLYSIGTIEEEMRVASAYYRAAGKEEEIVKERFEIVDEEREAKELFEQLNETLTASWDLMYSYARKYYEEHGNLEAEKRYKTKEGYSLGNWLATQRKVREGKQLGRLTAERIEKLDRIGMRWESVKDLSWQKHFAEAKKYYEKHGNLEVPAAYETESGVKLGYWLNNLRTYRKGGAQNAYLTEERIEALNEIGMLWNQVDYYWERNYAAALEYYREHGDLEVRADCVVNGIRLGSWIRNLRQGMKGKLGHAKPTEKQIERLNEIGMIWEDKYSRAWERGFAEAKEYFEGHGDLNVPTMYVTNDGFKLGKWISDQREKRNMPPERKERLDGIGMIWKKADSWELRFGLAHEFYREHGNLNVPANYIVQGIWLNKWVNEQKQIYAGKRAGKVLTNEQIKRLEEVGMVWK